MACVDPDCFERLEGADAELYEEYVYFIADVYVGTSEELPRLMHARYRPWLNKDEVIVKGAPDVEATTKEAASNDHLYDREP